MVGRQRLSAGGREFLFPFTHSGSEGRKRSVSLATGGTTAVELKGGARYIVPIMIREFFEFLSFIALLVPFVAIIMSFFM